MRVPLEIQKFVVHFCSVLYRAFFRRDVYKKGPPAQGRDRRQKKGVMEWGSIAPNLTSATFV